MWRDLIGAIFGPPSPDDRNLEHTGSASELATAREERNAALSKLDAVGAERWTAIREREEAEAARWEAVRAREQAELARWEAVRAREHADTALHHARTAHEAAIRERDLAASARSEGIKQRDDALTALNQALARAEQDAVAHQRADLRHTAAVRTLESIITRSYARDKNETWTTLPLHWRIDAALHIRWHSREEMANVDHARINEEFAAILDHEDFSAEPLERQIALLTHIYSLISQSWHESGKQLRPCVQRLFERQLEDHLWSTPKHLDFILVMYDLLYFLYWCWSHSIDDQSAFSRVAQLFAAAVRSSHAINTVPAKELRPATPIKVGYLAQFTSPDPGNAIVPISHRFLTSLAERPFQFKPILYPWMSHDRAYSALLAGRGVWVRDVKGDTLEERLSCLEGWIEQDRPDVLVTDMNAAIPTVIFEKRLAPIQVFYQFGLPYWPIANLDGVFRIWGTDPERVGFSVNICFDMLPPWNIVELAPALDPQAVQIERRKFPPRRLIGTYGRLAKITPEFLASVGTAIKDIPDVTVLLGGSGDARQIHLALDALEMKDRFIVVDRYVDGHLWGHFLDVFLDTFPQQGFTSCREVIAKGKPVLSLCTDDTPNFSEERIPELLAKTPTEYSTLLERLLSDRSFYDRTCAETVKMLDSMPRNTDYANAISEALDRLYQKRWGMSLAQLYDANESRMD